MKSSEVRQKYIEFFKSKAHRQIDPAPLVLENDPSTLFTSAGMQPLVPYLTGEPYPGGAKRLVDSQPSIRLGDIEEVGDNRHITFFEMLGNWSLGDYFKDEQLNWIWEFFTHELGLSKEKLWVSVFKGDNQVPKDTDSYNIWKKIGVPEERIVYYPAKKNWWSMTGTPSEMNVGHIGGPDSEVFFDFGEEYRFHENSVYKDKICHPNCDCGRFLEIGNSVFIQYKKVSDTALEELPQKNVDFGGGLERITAAVNGNPDIFATDLFLPVIEKLQNLFHIKYEENQTHDKSMRIIAEHLRASSMIISSGVYPSNKTQGYVLRRLIRRAVLHARYLSFDDTGIKLPEVDFSEMEIPLKQKPANEINEVIRDEAEKFNKALSHGMAKLKKALSHNIKITGDFAFDLYQTEGFPLEVTLEVLEKEGLKFSDRDKKEFAKEFEDHKEKSRTSSAGVFKGGLADHSPEVIRFHTATHLLLASLRKVLGDQIVQKGQNITKERSRFDFPNSEKLSDAQLNTVENMINDVVDKNLPVKFEIMTKEEALKTGAIHAFNEKYADMVKVYFVGESFDNAYSKEFCGGPHVTSTGEIGRVRIKKQEKIGSGLMRIYLVFEDK